MCEKLIDLLIIGGGVNGCGIARDAAGRGYSVCLVEMDDLASGTSSAATKLIHGGLRYLEHYEFRLVRESLTEREILWNIAPHIIWPLRFILPHHKGLRPAWILRFGLFLYDHIGGRKKLPATKTINLAQHRAGEPLRDKQALAFEYSDCWVDDARLVVLNAMDARERGANIRTRTQFLSAQKQDDHWSVSVKNLHTGEIEILRTRMLINASGPWIDEVLGHVGSKTKEHNVRLVKGSHIVVNKLFDHDKCYIFQNTDNRIVFAIPYEGDFTLIGTTDMDYDGAPGEVAISSEEIAYLCDVTSEYFSKPVTRDRVVWAFSGVRPLYDDGASAAQEATRDYVLKLEQGESAPALLNIFGGKLTTYRRLSEEVLENVDAVLGRETKPWTSKLPLPGGDFDAAEFEVETAELRRNFPFLSHAHAHRLMRLYGTRARAILGDAEHMKDLGENFGVDFTQAEVDYLVQHEWAQTVEDILWRRTKLGLHMNTRDVRALVQRLDISIAATPL